MGYSVSGLWHLVHKRGALPDLITRFLRSYLRFAPPTSRLEEVAADAGLQEKSLSDLQLLADTLQDGIAQADREHISRYGHISVVFK